MRIVFVSNYINHHQIPVSDELFLLTKGSYAFIQTEPMEEERVNMGWDINSMKKPYVHLLYEDEEYCRKLILEADCVIFGGTEKEGLIIPRLEENKFTIQYSERLYKEGRWKFITPRGLIKKYHDHTRFRKGNVYLLCAGAYVAGDFSLVRAYPKKKLKYGYFPELVFYEDVHAKRRANNKCEILWAARFIDWKHPEIVADLAKKLYDNSLDAHITMIGSGELFDEISNRCKGLSDIITFAGSKTPSEVRNAMEMSDIFISTSDQKEGWGAVVNEAMNSGCVTIAAKEIGAAPYLIENGVDGFMYKACNKNQLYKIVESLVYNSDRRYEIGSRAYEKIKTLWNPEVAAKRLYDFICDETHAMPAYQDGPLSKG